jgi:amino acid transporter
MEWLNSMWTYIVANYALYVVVVMGTIVALITCVLNLLKKPIKAVTKKIENEKLRKFANKVIILLSFGLSVLLWYLLNLVLPNYFGFEFASIMITGALPVVVYALGDGIITKSQAKFLADTVIEIVEDKKVTEQEQKQVVNKLDDLLNQN